MSTIALPAPATSNRLITAWLIVCAGSIFLMVVIGGLTRLTGSGLSMVDWQPVYGILPPMSETDWRALFAKYQASPEFQKVNFWMTVDDFKSIFWLEYFHRVWGRVIGVIFLLPFLYFAFRGRLTPSLLARLSALFVLGALQGLLGWYMVKSGLVDRPEVSQYRLAAHLALAFLIYGYMIWLIATMNHPRGAAVSSVPAGHARLVMIWAFVTVVSGAFVAGTDAGMAYNTFPLMDGYVIPPGAFSHEPWLINFFENTAAIQLLHRYLAIALVLLTLAFWWRHLRQRNGATPSIHLLTAAVFLQACLGIVTLLTQVPVALGAGHQAGALIVFTLSVWCAACMSKQNRPQSA